MPKNEMNVSKLWEQGITGEGVRVALIDDGLDYTSLDLKDNFVRPLCEWMALGYARC
jgi:kexin